MTSLPDSASERSVLVHCNAGAETGMGHLMRALTVAAEAAARGWAVAVIGDLDHRAMQMIRSRLSAARVHCVERARQREDLPALVETFAPDVVHIDSYAPEADVLLGARALVSNVVDGEFGARPAALTIDPNLDAELSLFGSSGGTIRLAGVSYALIRSQVRGVRGRWEPSARRSRVLVVLGGTDPYGLTPVVLDALADSRRRLDLTVVAPPAVEDAVKRIAAQSPSTVNVVGFLEDLPAAAVEHDLVISAAGTSVWDLACMGVPTAMVCVTENQLPGYDAAAARGIAIGLQREPRGSWSGLADVVVDVLDDQDRLRGLSELGMAAVDGFGAWRMVSAWERILDGSATRTEPSGFVARRASGADARMLFDWRNDPDTRRMSRSAHPISWDEHISWFAKSLSDDSRELLVVEHDGQPIGTVRWDHRAGPDWEVSISLAPSSRGRGLSAGVLAAGEREIRSRTTRRLIASINDANNASRRLFEGAGYLPYSPPDDRGFGKYAKLCIADIEGPATS